MSEWQPSEAVPHDAHVQAAHGLFRATGFSLAAMQYPRPPEALDALKGFNGLAPDAKVPIAWGYFPNAWCRDNWRTMYSAPVRREPAHG